MSHLDSETAPCRRCGEPYQRKRGRRFCAGCTRHGRAAKGISARVAAEGIACLVRGAEMGEALSQQEVAVALGMTRQGVQHIEQRALAKLRAAMGSPEDWL